MKSLLSLLLLINFQTCFENSYVINVDDHDVVHVAEVCCSCDEFIIENDQDILEEL